jgi:uncharacterized protein YkwD
MAITRSHTAARGRVAATSCALLLASGCAGAAGGAAVGRDLVGKPAVVADGQLAPARPAAPSYGGEASGSCQASVVIRTVMTQLEDAAKRAGRPSPVLDPAVCGVAEAFLGWDPTTSPRPEVVTFVSQWFGLPAPVLPPVGATLRTADEKLVAERVVQAVGSSVLSAIHPRLGMAVQRTGRDDKVSYTVSFTMLDAPLVLDPLPRRLEAGQRAKLSGRLVAGARDPKVLVSDARGRLSTPEQPAGEAFEAELACGDQPGKLLVEIRGEYQGAEGVVASFPVACAGELPARVAVAPEPWPTDPAAAERKILEVVNAERAAAGLPPLAWDAAVAGVARDISRDLAASGSAGGDVAARLKKEGIGSPVVLQSAASERSFERAQERLLSSPTNRANLLSPEATHAGIGAATRADPQGRPLVFVTEVFIKELPPVDVERARKELRDAVARKRKDARTNALASDATLDQTAQRYAEALAAAGGVLPKEKASELTFPLNKGFRAVTMVSGAKQELLDFAEEPQTTAPGRVLGVGVAQGRHPALGRNAVYVVLMVGTPRK